MYLFFLQGSWLTAPHTLGVSSDKGICGYVYEATLGKLLGNQPEDQGWD